MKIEFNRFAIVPVLCAECNKFILFEPYRTKKIKRYIFFNEYDKIKVCKECSRQNKSTTEDFIEGTIRKIYGLDFEELIDTG